MVDEYTPGEVYEYLTDSDRPRGILTDTDRKYLADEIGEIEKNTEYQRRHRIRNRFREALIDGVLLQNLSPDDIRQIFGKIFPNTTDPETLGEMDEDERFVVAGVRGLIHVLFLGMGTEQFKTAIEGSRNTQGGVGRAIFRSVVAARDAVPVGLTVELNISIRGYAPLDDVEERYHNGQPLTEEALEGLVLTGRIEPEEIMEYENVTADENVLPVTIPDELINPTD